MAGATKAWQHAAGRSGEVSFDYVGLLEEAGPGPGTGSPYTLAQQVELLEAGAAAYGPHASTGRYLRESAARLRRRLAAVPPAERGDF